MSNRCHLQGQRDDVDPRIWKIAGVVLLGPLMSSLDSTVVNVSLEVSRSETGHRPNREIFLCSRIGNS